MARIEIARVTMDRPAEPIHEPLLTTQQSKVEAGRNELDDKGSFKSILDIQVFPDAIFKPGQLVRVILDGEEFTARVLSLTLTLGVGNKNLSVQVERNLV